MATARQRDALAELKSTLNYLGIGQLADWAWKQIVAGRSQAEILLGLEQTRVFKTAFPEIEARRKAGLAPMSAGQIVQYRQQVRQILDASGVAPRVLNDRGLYQRLLIADKSPAEIERRMTRGWAEIADSAPEVIRTFARWFGDGRTPLATIILDPKLGAAEVERMAAAAKIGGLGQRFGFDFTQGRAQQIARAGVAGEQIGSGLEELSRMDDLFDETVTERGDLAAEDEGADLVYGLGSGEAVRRRAAERQASTGGGGGAALGREGVVGLGAAE